MYHRHCRIIPVVACLIAIPFTTPIRIALAASSGSAVPAVAHHRVSTDQPPLAKRGDRSPTVKRLQRLLVRAGIVVPGGVDGVFGSGTEAAVKGYQTQRGLTVNGTLDVPTATVLGMIPATPLLKRGGRSDAVRSAQQQLLAVGMTLRGGADGVYGSATTAAVRAFQRSHGLGVTGSIDAGTAAVLANAAALIPPLPPTATPITTPPPTTSSSEVLLKRGSRGEDVKVMQRQLIAVGVSVFGGADGVFGAATEASLKKFQAGAGLPTTGILDTVTQVALVAAGSAPPTTPPPTTPPPTVVLAAFPVSATCAFSDTYGAPRSGGRRHEGVDIMVGTGTPIYAVVNGTITKKQVAFVGSLAGNALWITEPSGTYFFYGHLSAFAEGIEVGSVVAAGTLIGYVGATGNASVPHLHFEVHPNGGAAVNPFPIVKALTNCR